MRKYSIYLSLFLILMAGCKDKVNPVIPEEDKPETSLEAPSGLWVERLTETIVKVNWRDNSDSETGYSIFLLPEGAEEAELIGTADQDETSFVVSSGLSSGLIYNIGVRADAEKEELSSETAYVSMKPLPSSSIPTGNITAAVGTESCLAVTYTIVNNKFEEPEIGVCWSSEGAATYTDNRLVGPESLSGAMQVISNLYLDYGVTYNVRAYLKSEAGVFYFGSADIALDPEPAAVEFKWNKIGTNDLPSGISLYETNDKLDGKGFHGYYVEADLLGSDIELRTNVPASVTTIDDQAAMFDGDCYVMINGGYFASGYHTGLAINDYRVNGTINNPRGSIVASDPENTEYYPAGRAVFGVDDNGEASVYWGNGGGTLLTFFSRPIPSVKGEAKYPSRPYEWESAEMVDWLPRAAISAAPVLLKDGKIPFDFTQTPRGDSYYYTNFEFVAYDIFGPDSVCDRTAIGVKADGKVVMFICDGRMDSVKGIDLMELARIMKGLGCVDAINLDGGGSTGMVVGDVHYGDTTVGGNRKVMSTVGLFRRR